MPPKVSVIIPTYNRSALLRRTVQSVLNQTFTDYEIVIVNNSSTDDTRKMIESLNDQRIKVYDTQNGGIIASSRNMGIKNSQGDYISFLDDDDLWTPDKLEKQAAYLDKNPQFFLVYSPVWTIDENDVKKEFLAIKRHPREGDLFEELVRGNYIPQLTVMIRRVVAEKIGVFNTEPEYRSIEDYDYWLRIASRYKIGYINEPLGLYRVHSGGVSKSVNESLLNQMVLKKYLKDPQGPIREIISERINDLYCKSAIYNWRTGNRKDANRDLKAYAVWSARRLKAINLFKAAAVYLSLISGIYRVFLKHRRHFRSLLAALRL